MKAFLRKLIPEKLNDVYFWLLSIVVFLPVVYILLDSKITYMILNFICFVFICVFLLVRFIVKIIKGKTKKEMFYFMKKKAFLILTFMIFWLFVSCFFSKNPKASWFGMNNGYHMEISIFQYVFFYVVAVLALIMDKNNIKRLLYLILVVINFIIILQLINKEFEIGFVNRNHAGYYLAMTVTISIGLVLYSKNVYEIILVSLSCISHFFIMAFNCSLGPVLALIIFLIVSFIYYLVHSRKKLLRLSIVILACVVSFSIVDYVPKVSEYKTEKAPVAIQIRDVSLYALNKIGIVSKNNLIEIASKDEFYGGGSDIGTGHLSAGSDGYDRLDMWKISLENMKEYPVFGIGVGAFKTYNVKYARTPHNEFLEYGAMGGVPVLLFYVALFIYLFVKFRKKHKEQEALTFIISGAVISYLVSSFFGALMPSVLPVFYMMIGLMINLVDKKENVANANIDSETNLEKEEK